jgi:ATP-dependent Clp protease ATP-binding subunit ClpA
MVADQKLALEITDAARDLIAVEGYDPAFGARPLKRAMQNLLLNPLSSAVIEGGFVEGDHVIVDREAGEDRLGFKRAGSVAAVAD